MIRFHLFLGLLCFLGVKGLAAHFNCEVLKNVTWCKIENGRLFQTDSVVIQINNRMGEGYAEVEINYNKDNPVNSLSAWIEDKYGNVVRYLKNKEITDANAVSSSFYSEEFTRSFVLKHSDYPYKICYTYKTTYRHFLNIIQWCPVIGNDVPTRDARLILIHPESYPVHILQTNVNQANYTSEAGIISQTWNSSYDGNFKMEIYSPDYSNFLPHVKIIPVNFIYGIPGSMLSWETFGNWQYQLIKGLDVLPEIEITTIHKLIQHITDKREIVRTLYHYLQDNTRYINVVINFGGLKPFPASYVSLNKFGDCKALTVYMKALLNAAGIKSDYVLVFGSNRVKEIEEEVPYQQFNHVILAVPLENDTIWLENTNNNLPFGYIGTFTQNRKALLIDEFNSRLVNVPALSAEDVRESSKMTFLFNADGSARVEADYDFKGYNFEVFSELIADHTKESQNEFVHKFLPFPAFELELWSLTKVSRDTRNIVLEATVKLNHLTQSLGKESCFSLQPVKIPVFEPPTERKLPVLISYPIVQYDSLTYQLPSGKNFLDIPENFTIQNKYGSYKIEFSAEGEMLKIFRELKLYAAFIPVNEYFDFHKFLAAIKTTEKQKILFQ